MGIFNKKEEKGKKTKGDGLVTFETICEDVKAARKGHTAWWKGAGSGELSYLYRETSQKPKSFPDGLKVYAQVNIVKEDIESRNGMLAQSKITWDIKGASRGSYDKRRIHIQQSMLEWLQDEIELDSELLDAFDDYNTCGMTFLRPTYDKYKLSKINTLGMIRLNRLPPETQKMDPSGLKCDGLEGRFYVTDIRLTRSQFIDTYKDLIKGINVDLLFEAPEKQGHYDHGAFTRNKNNPGEDNISVIQYDYLRWVSKSLRYYLHLGYFYSV